MDVKDILQKSANRIGYLNLNSSDVVLAFELGHVLGQLEIIIESLDEEEKV